MIQSCGTESSAFFLGYSDAAGKMNWGSEMGQILLRLGGSKGGGGEGRLSPRIFSETAPERNLACAYFFFQGEFYAHTLFGANQGLYSLEEGGKNIQGGQRS